MNVTTMRFGGPEEIEVPEELIYEFYPGLNGFEDDHRYALIIDEDSAVQWLQAVSNPNVCFPLLDPALFLADYAFELPDPDAEALGVAEASDIAVRLVVTLRDPLDQSTANLLAPVLMNPAARVGRQVVLQDTEHPIRYPVFEGMQVSSTDGGAVDGAEESTTQEQARAA